MANSGYANGFSRLALGEPFYHRFLDSLLVRQNWYLNIARSVIVTLSIFVLDSFWGWFSLVEHVVQIFLPDEEPSQIGHEVATVQLMTIAILFIVLIYCLKYAHKHGGLYPFSCLHVSPNFDFRYHFSVPEDQKGEASGYFFLRLLIDVRAVRQRVQVERFEVYYRSRDGRYHAVTHQKIVVRSPVDRLMINEQTRYSFSPPIVIIDPNQSVSLGWKARCFPVEIGMTPESCRGVCSIFSLLYRSLSKSHYS